MKKILVIEDEDNIRSFVVINLKRAGYDVLEAASGEEAFEVLERNRDVVLMVVDLMLPGIDGYEICRRIRARGSDMGIVMLTKCAEVWVFGDNHTPGMHREIKKAKLKHIPIRYFDTDCQEVTA